MERIIDNHYSESEGKRSPWGNVQTEIVFGDTGIRFVSTAGHGGFILSGKANLKIPKVFRINGGAYEEDCDASIVLAFLFDKIHQLAIDNNYESWPLLLRPEGKDEAINCLKKQFSYPANWAVYSGETLSLEAFEESKGGLNYSSYDAYLEQIKLLQEKLNKKSIKLKEGMKLRFKNAFSFTIGGKSVELSEFKAVNVGFAKRAVWRFEVINHPEHSFLANLTGWRKSVFELI